VRRVLPAALAAAVVVAGCDSAHHSAAVSTTRPKPSKQTGNVDEPVPSPDGNRVAVARHVGQAGYLEIGSARARARRRVVFSSPNGCCGNILWTLRTLLVFIENYNRVWTVDLRNGRAKRIAASPRSTFLETAGGSPAGTTTAPTSPARSA
jgi:hypothetical protein